MFDVVEDGSGFCSVCCVAEVFERTSNPFAHSPKFNEMPARGWVVFDVDAAGRDVGC